MAEFTLDRLVHLPYYRLMSELFPIKVVKAKVTCPSCPCQVEGKTNDNKYFYLRYRGGRLTVYTAPSKSSFHPSVNPPVIKVQIGDRFDGVATQDKFSLALEGKVIMPDEWSWDKIVIN